MGWRPRASAHLVNAHQFLSQARRVLSALASRMQRQRPGLPRGRWPDSSRSCCKWAVPARMDRPSSSRSAASGNLLNS